MGLFGKKKKEDKKSIIRKTILDVEEYIYKKSLEGEDLNRLNEVERVIYIVLRLEMEVNNGGFLQFFFNSSGDFSNELVYSFEEIKAFKTAKICQKALGIFGKEVPIDVSEREKLFGTIETDEIYEFWEECDKEFYKYEEDLQQLNYEYIMKNKKELENGNFL